MYFIQSFFLFTCPGLTDPVFVKVDILAEVHCDEERSSSVPVTVSERAWIVSMKTVLHSAVQSKAWGVFYLGVLQVLQWEGIVGFVGVTVIVGSPV